MLQIYFLQELYDNFIFEEIRDSSRRGSSQMRKAEQGRFIWVRYLNIWQRKHKRRNVREITWSSQLHTEFGLAYSKIAHYMKSTNYIWRHAVKNGKRVKQNLKRKPQLNEEHFLTIKSYLRSNSHQETSVREIKEDLSSTHAIRSRWVIIHGFMSMIAPNH
jgi:translation initiation factor 2 alpha subunit (eIF-2alpha)